LLKIFGKKEDMFEYYLIINNVGVVFNMSYFRCVWFMYTRTQK